MKNPNINLVLLLEASWKNNKNNIKGNILPAEQRNDSSVPAVG